MKTLTSTLLLLTFLSHFTNAQSGNRETEKQKVYACPPCNSKCDTLSFSHEGNCEHCGMELVLKSSLKETTPPPQTTIAFYLQNGVEVLDFAGPLEVFSYAGFKIFTVSKHKKPILSQGVLQIMPDYSIQDAPKADIIAFFGGNSGAMSKDTAVINWLKAQHEAQYHFSVCTGAFALAEAGILDGKTATTFHTALDGLSEYKQIDVRRDVRFVDNGRVISTAGISAGIDGALHLVAKLKGFNMARQTAYHMEYDKWVPAEGLILSPDNPYSLLEKAEELKRYVGKYEYQAGGQVSVVFNKREKSLEAEVNQQKVPLFHEKDGIFSNPQGLKIHFESSEDGEILGYRLGNSDKLLKKLK